MEMTITACYIFLAVATFAIAWLMRRRVAP